MTRNSNASVLPELRSIFAHGGTRAALAYLNALTSHRFTSLYRFDRDMLRNVIFYDRERPEVTTSEDIPIMASYCVFVRDSGATFLVEEACSDERVKDHPKRNVLQSYCGVPLFDEDGKMFGTICHFDFKPGRVAELDIELLEYMARLLPESHAPQAS